MNLKTRNLGRPSRNWTTPRTSPSHRDQELTRSHHEDAPLGPGLSSLLARMEQADPELCRHGRRTAVDAVLLGQAAGLSDQELTDLHHAALLHDIGKLALPRTIRRKCGPLSLEEYALVQCHPRVGAEILEAVPSLRIPALLIAHHHERWDGAGYPYGLPGRLIPLGSRILAVADTFDALTSARSFRSAGDPDAAFRLLQTLAGTQLDPGLVDACVRLAPRLREHAEKPGFDEVPV